MTAIYILLKFSRSKCYKTIKFSQLTEHIMKNSFIEKSSTKDDKENSPRSFFKRTKLSISLDQQSESFVQFVLIVCQSRALPKYIVTKVLTTCFKFI